MNYTVTYLPKLEKSGDWDKLKTPELLGFTPQVVCIFSLVTINHI